MAGALGHIGRKWAPALAMTEYTSMASATQPVWVPKLMMEKAFSGQCCVEVRPTVGRRPTMPHSAEGTRTEPPPSMPAHAYMSLSVYRGWWRNALIS